MSVIDLEKLDLTQLKALQRDIEKRISDYADRQRREAFEAANAAAREYGFSLSELVTTTKAGKVKAPVAPKYANPEDPSQTWSGRGRQPKWLSEAIASGKTAEDFAIDKG